MSDRFDMHSIRKVIPCVIAAGETESAVIDLTDGGCLVGIETDAGFVTGNITFKGTAQAVASTEGRFTSPALAAKALVNSSNAAPTVTGVGASETVPFVLALKEELKPIRYVQLVCAATQTNGTTIYLIVMPPT